MLHMGKLSFRPILGDIFHSQAAGRRITHLCTRYDSERKEILQ